MPESLQHNEMDSPCSSSQTALGSSFLNELPTSFQNMTDEQLDSAVKNVVRILSEKKYPPTIAYHRIKHSPKFDLTFLQHFDPFTRHVLLDKARISRLSPSSNSPTQSTLSTNTKEMREVHTANFINFIKLKTTYFKTRRFHESTTKKISTIDEFKKYLQKEVLNPHFFKSDDHKTEEFAKSFIYIINNFSVQEYNNLLYIALPQLAKISTVKRIKIVSETNQTAKSTEDENFLVDYELSESDTSN